MKEVISIKEIESPTGEQFTCYKLQKSNGEFETIYSKTVNTGLWPFDRSTTRQYFKINKNCNINDLEVYKPIQDPETIRLLEKHVENYYQKASMKTTKVKETVKANSMPKTVVAAETMKANDADRSEDSNLKVDTVATTGTPKSAKTSHRLRRSLAVSEGSAIHNTSRSSSYEPSWINQAAETLLKTWMILTTIGSRLTQFTAKDYHENKQLASSPITIYKDTPLTLHPNHTNVYNKSVANLPNIHTNNLNMYNQSAVSLASAASSNISLSNIPVLHASSASVSNRKQLHDDPKSSISQINKDSTTISPTISDASAKLETDIDGNIEPYSISIYHNSREEQEMDLTPEDRARFNELNGNIVHKILLKKVRNIYRNVLKITNNENGKVIATFIIKDYKDSYLVRYNYKIQGAKIDATQDYPFDVEQGLASSIAVNFANNFDLRSLAEKIGDQDLTSTSYEHFYDDIPSNMTPSCNENSSTSQDSCYEDTIVSAARDHFDNGIFKMVPYSSKVSFGVHCNSAIMKYILPEMRRTLKLVREYMSSHSPACSLLGAPTLTDPNTMELGINEIAKSDPFIHGTNRLNDIATINSAFCVLLSLNRNVLVGKANDIKCFYGMFVTLYKNMGSGPLYEQIMSHVGDKTPQEIPLKNDTQPRCSLGRISRSDHIDNDNKPDMILLHNLYKVKAGLKYLDPFIVRKRCYEMKVGRPEVYNFFQDLRHQIPKTDQTDSTITQSTMEPHESDSSAPSSMEPHESGSSTPSSMEPHESDSSAPSSILTSTIETHSVEPTESNSNVPNVPTATELTTPEPSHTPTKLTPWQKIVRDLVITAATLGAITGATCCYRKCTKNKYDRIPDEDPERDGIEMQSQSLPDGRIRRGHVEAQSPQEIDYPNS